MKRWFTGFMMSWGMFLAIPCPCRIWDEKARPHMVACLPLTGGVVGILSGQSPTPRALRQLVVGYGAAGVTYLLGLLFGTSVS